MNVVSPIDVTSVAAGVGDVVPMILSGGSGARLWPVSRESFPKPFWPLVSDRSLIEETVRRAVGNGFAPPIVVCNQGHRFLVSEQLRLAGLDGARIVLEPEGCNSAAAIAAAASLAAEQGPDTVLWMMLADAGIADVEALHRLVAAAVTAARAGLFVTFGMRSTKPKTGYGYIEVGAPMSGLPGVRSLILFVEKPDAATLLAELHRYAPEVLSAVTAAISGRMQDLDFIRLAPEPFRACPNISLDYAVAEHTRRAVVVPADLGWSDVGSWSVLWALGSKDPRGNVTVGDAQNCYVRSDGIVTAVVGLRTRSWWSPRMWC
jgi:mannose-1-phosphate guanylyltransferase/mannose-6-phosphate isomerase